MKRKESFSFIARLKSLSNATSGLVDMISTEHNAWIHALVTVIVLILSWFLGVNAIEFTFIVISIVMVWTAEAFNTVLEIMADLVVGQRYSAVVKRAKDIAAAAVLIAVFGAIVVGVIILGPHFHDRLTTSY